MATARLGRAPNEASVSEGDVNIAVTVPVSWSPFASLPPSLLLLLGGAFGYGQSVRGNHWGHCAASLSQRGMTRNCCAADDTTPPAQWFPLIAVGGQNCWFQFSVPCVVSLLLSLWIEHPEGATALLFSYSTVLSCCWDFVLFSILHIAIPTNGASFHWMPSNHRQTVVRIMSAFSNNSMPLMYFNETFLFSLCIQFHWHLNLQIAKRQPLQSSSTLHCCSVSQGCVCEMRLHDLCVPYALALSPDTFVKLLLFVSWTSFLFFF